MHTTNNNQFGMLHLSGLCITSESVSGFILSIADLALEHLFAAQVKKKEGVEDRGTNSPHSLWS